MAHSTNANRGKGLAKDIFDTASNVGEPMQGEMLLVVQKMMKEMGQHRKEMATQKSAASGRQSEHTSFRQTKQTPYHQTEPTSSRKIETTPFSYETFSRKNGMSMTDLLAKFKKFAPPSFNEAKKYEKA